MHTHNVQWEYPVKNDWVKTVKQDLMNLNINTNLEEIHRRSKQNFAKLVKEKVKSAAFSELMRTKKAILRPRI